MNKFKLDSSIALCILEIESGSSKLRKWSFNFLILKLDKLIIHWNFQKLYYGKNFHTICNYQQNINVYSATLPDFPPFSCVNTISVYSYIHAVTSVMKHCETLCILLLLNYPTYFTYSQTYVLINISRINDRNLTKVAYCHFQKVISTHNNKHSFSIKEKYDISTKYMFGGRTKEEKSVERS